MKSIILQAAALIVCSGVLSVCAFADSCDSILSGGIFDYKYAASSSIRLSIAQRTVCGSENSANISELSTTSKNYCDKSLEELLAIDSSLSELRTASDIIVKAWSSCVTGTRGLIHYIQPTADPDVFYYVIKYNPNSRKNTVNLRSWTMTPSSVAESCHSISGTQAGRVLKRPLGKGSIIDPAGTTLLCKRSRDQQVDVAVNADETIVGSDRNPGLSLPADPVKWYLVMGSADDGAKCALTSPSNQQKYSYTAYIGSTTKVVNLNSFLEKGQNRLSCTASDIHPQDGHACWHYTIRVLRDGDDYWNQSQSCCSTGCGTSPVEGSPGVTILMDSVVIPFN
jgi:hypothetical protein